MNVFSELDIIHHSEMEIMGGITLPFLFHIKDIKDKHINSTMYSTEFNTIYECKKLKEIITNIYKYVNIDLFLIDEEDYKEFKKVGIEFVQDSLIKNKYKLKDKENVKKLLDLLELSETELYNIQEFITEEQNDLVTKFLEILHSLLEVNVKSTHLSEAFMSIQICVEFGNSVIFPENVNKAMSEFSFRELQTKRCYLARKYEVEKLQYEEMRSKNK